MTTKEFDNIRNPKIRTDKSLDKYTEKPIFQEKLDEANETLSRVPLPKKYLKSKSK